jgi:hypothetical protein
LWPRDISHAKSCTPAIEKKRAWQLAKAKPFGKIFIGGFAFAHSHLCRHTSRFFFNRFRSAFVMPYAPRTFTFNYFLKV